MDISKTQFYDRMKDGNLQLSFIGMSNIGKSFTAMRLRKSHGFALYEVDESIQHALNLKSMQESADWMGFPFENSYAEREAKYLKLESELTLAGLNRGNGNAILDTTGSVIYTSEATQDILKAQSVVVHIKAGPNNLARLEKLYSRSPKPLIWAGQYRQSKGRSNAESLLQCYPELLKSRMAAYEILADVNLPASLLFEGTTTPEMILDEIATALDS